MNTLNRRKMFLYSALFIALALNAPKLLALRKNGIVAHFWHFDLGELFFQFVMSFLFCLTIFELNKNRGSGWRQEWPLTSNIRLVAINLLVMILFALVSGAIHHFLFLREDVIFGSYGLRYLLCLILVGVELRVWFLMEEARVRETENEHLRTAYLRSELALLKGQLNPHFFFNALSSLSAVVREDPKKAQQYIQHLSRAFRYSLQSSEVNLIPLKEELDAVRSYAELLKMRYEDGFRLDLPPDDAVNGAQIPPMSLQLLVENALKHNRATVAQPLRVEIRLAEDSLEVRNNLQPVRNPEPGTGIGLANLNERYKILLHREIGISRTETDFIVKLPLP